MPPAKKRRIDAASAAEEIQEKNDGSSLLMQPIKHDMNTTNSILTSKLIEQHQETLKTLRSNISELVASSSSSDGDNNIINKHELILSSSLALSNLKSLQRQISLQVEAHATSSRVQRENVEECSLVLENLNYERNYLRGEIALMKEWDASELEKMARKELGLDPTTGKEVKVGKGGGEDDDKMEVDDDDAINKITTAEEAIDAYLLGGEDSNTTDIKSSHRDPSNHEYILEKLQSNLQTRSSLVEQLSKSKSELKELQKKRDTYRNFLNEIPKKLVALEKAGESLNTFFGGGGNSGVWKDVLNDTTNNDGDDEVMDAASRKTKVQAANLLVNRPSCDRTKRFQLAQSNLPSPLYVLFVQLAGYLDAWSSLELLGAGGDGACSGKDTKILDGFVGANGMDVAAVPPEEVEGSDDSWNVVLSLSPSDIIPPEIGSVLGKSYANSRSTTSIIKIIFSYNKEQGVVFASVNDDEANHGLLDGLFPGDDGVANPNVSLSLLKRDEDEFDDHDSDNSKDLQDEEKSHAEDKSIGKPYYWCQVLSGLDLPPPSSSNKMNETTASNGGGVDAPSFQIQTCTKAVFRQLLRRIRARKTLAAMLEYMGKRSQLHPLPIHPTMKGEENADVSNQPQSIKAKLQSWVEDSREGGTDKVSGTSYKKIYTATIKRKSSTLRATVTIDTQSYPSEPPVWSLQNEDGSSGTLSSWGEDHGSVSSLQQNSNNVSGAPPLFDAALHRIECHVNQDLDKFVRQDVENTYDWILIHQLADIVSSWDEVMSASEGGFGSSSGSKGKGGSVGERMHKGKDRRLVGFGERSPFFLYRNGL